MIPQGAHLPGICASPRHNSAGFATVDATASTHRPRPSACPQESSWRAHLDSDYILLYYLIRLRQVKGSDSHECTRDTQMVGAWRAHAGGTGGWPGWHRPQRGAAHARQRTPRFGGRPPMVLLGLPAGARGGHVAGGSAGRPLRPQKSHADCPGLLRARLGGLRLCAVRGRVHRGAGTARTGWRRHHRDGALRANGALHRGRAAARCRHLGGRQLPGAADWTHSRWVAANALLVGLGLPAPSPSCQSRVPPCSPAWTQWESSPRPLA
jgi:hypothetical protein